MVSKKTVGKKAVKKRVVSRKTTAKKITSNKPVGKKVANRNSLLSKYHNELQNKMRGQVGDFLYRGQENADWKLRSGAVRRIFPGGETDELQKLIEKKKNFDFHEENLRYHEELLERAKIRGWYRETGGRELQDLELLAKLQHHGAATCLLDFTTRFDVALWFACKKAEDKKKDGIVFIVDVAPKLIKEAVDLCRIGSKDLKYGIGEILRFETRRREGENFLYSKSLFSHSSGGKYSRFWYWHPETLMGRMLSQESRFIFGLEDISDGEGGMILKRLRVDAVDKEPLLAELEQYYGLNRESIVPDIQGFADANNHQAFFPQKSIREHMRDGIKNFNRGELVDAVRNFDRVIKSGKKEEYTAALLYRSFIKLLLGVEQQTQGRAERKMLSTKYGEESIQDCNELINQKSHIAEAYNLRNLANQMLGRSENARSDMQEARDLYEAQGNQEGVKFIEEQSKKLDELEQGRDKSSDS